MAYDRVKLPFVVSSRTVNYHTAKLYGMQNGISILDVFFGAVCVWGRCPVVKNG